jgi:hypothetical protein
MSMTSKRLLATGFLLLAMLLAGCRASPPVTTAPDVIATLPADGATDVELAATITASVSEALDPVSLTSETFTVTSGAAAVPVRVAGTVSVSGEGLRFVPSSPLAPDTLYTVTLAPSARSLSGQEFGVEHSWSFITQAAATSSAAVAPKPLAEQSALSSASR